MIKLKHVLIEQTITANVKDSELGIGTLINGISESDPYEYFIQFDKLSEPAKFYTRLKKKKGSWIDLKSKLSADKFKEATGIIVGALENKSNYKSAAGSNPADDLQKQKQAVKHVTSILKDLLKVLSTDADKYFKPFSNLVNDSEEKAAAWFKKATKEAYSGSLQWLKSNGFSDAAADITSIINTAYDMIKNDKFGTLSGNIPIGTNVTRYEIKWDYFRY